MAWRLARALDTLRIQVNAAAPNRSKVSDGTIGDAAHSSRASDHNPDGGGVVRALDITHDPDHGFNSWDFADMLRARRDPRIKYVISKGRIFSGNAGPSAWIWRPYTGSNSHTHHVHISVVAGAAGDDTKPWDIGGDWNANKEAPANLPSRPKLRLGSRGDEVKKLQTMLGMAESERDGEFGPKTKNAVQAFQKSKNLTPDGIAGPYTLDALGWK